MVVDDEEESVLDDEEESMVVDEEESLLDDEEESLLVDEEESLLGNASNRLLMSQAVQENIKHVASIAANNLVFFITDFILHSMIVSLRWAVFVFLAYAKNFIIKIFSF